MRILVALLGALITQTAGWGAAAERAPTDGWRLAATERLLTTPPVVIQFGWTASDVDGLMDELSASARPQLVLAGYPGVLEYVCSPRSILAWGTPLFRIYELDLLSDLRRAEAAAALIGDMPIVVAPRRFPSPVRGSVPIPLPPVVPTESAARQPSGLTEMEPEPLVRFRRPRVTPPAAPLPTSPARRSVVREPSGESVKAASARLTTAEERVRSMAALVEAAQDGVQAAGQTASRLREDVAARQRLADAGVIARNDVKAAQERLSEAVSATEAAQARVNEAEGALHAAKAERDAALAGVQAARTAGTVPERPSAPAAPEPATVPRDRTEGSAAALVSPALGPPAVPLDKLAPEFPSPTLTADGTSLKDVPPAPEETFRLAPRGDIPDLADWEPLPLPEGATDLARPRWHEQKAPCQCVVARALLPQGARVTEETPVLELRQTAIGRVRAEVDERYVNFCRVGVPVKVTFTKHGSTFRGWISRVEPTRSPRPPGALVEIVLVQGSRGEPGVYADLEWMALRTPMLPTKPAPLSYRPPQPVRSSPTEVSELFPLGPAGEREPEAKIAPPDGRLSGSLQLVSSKRPRRFQASDPVAGAKLRRLQDWRRSFIDGMKTTVFPETGLTLTYPREGEICRAVERMATRRVSNAPNMCARTLAEALGWGLGDAALWARRLPDRGYVRRADGVARPGDIVVWPFTYGPSRSQHVGIAVAQGGTMMLLSNEGGVLGTSPLKSGYLAFHKPRAGDCFAGAASSASAEETQPQPS